MTNGIWANWGLFSASQSVTRFWNHMLKKRRAMLSDFAFITYMCLFIHRDRMESGTCPLYLTGHWLPIANSQDFHEPAGKTAAWTGALGLCWVGSDPPLCNAGDATALSRLMANKKAGNSALFDYQLKAAGLEGGQVWYFCNDRNKSVTPE